MEHNVSRETFLYARHRALRGVYMDSKELSKLVNKFNKRIKRMYDFSGGAFESIDIVRQQLFMLTGKESTIPTISLKDIKKNDRTKLESIINTYIANPESTITDYKKSMGKGVLALGNRQGWNSGQSIKFNSLVKSPQFNKLKELFYNASEEVIDNVEGLISTDMSTKDITNVIDDYIKSDKTISFREWVDNAIQNYGEKSQ